MQIKGMAMLISGGGSGMGAACARYFSRFGAKVSILDMNLDAANIIAKEIGGKAYQCDVSKSESVENAIAQAEKDQGPARICINCAGIIHSRRMINKEGTMPLAEFEKVLAINLTGTFNVMRIAASKMIPLAPLANDERGVIINTASVAAYEGQIGQTAYSASKGGIVALTLPAARELAQFGIRVMTIAPGLVDTPMFEKIPDEARAQLAANVPFPKRLAHPEEFAQLAQQIIENCMLNGEVIRLDGALRLQPK